MKLLDATEGRIIFEGQDITDLTDDEIRPISKRIPNGFPRSLCVTKSQATVKEIIEEPLIVHNIEKKNVQTVLSSYWKLLG